MRKPAILLGAIAISAAILFSLTIISGGAGIGSRPTATPVPFTSQRDLDQLAETRLFYPGSQIIARTGSDFSSSLFANIRAYSGYKLGTDASEADLYAFYERELLARGWQLSPGDVVGGSAEKLEHA